MEKTRKETGLKRLMSNYIKLLFCAVVSVALFYGCDNDDNNINPGRTPKFSEKSYISVYIKAKQLRYFYMSDTYDSIQTDPYIRFSLLGEWYSDETAEEVAREFGDTAYYRVPGFYFLDSVVSDSIKKNRRNM